MNGVVGAGPVGVVDADPVGVAEGMDAESEVIVMKISLQIISCGHRMHSQRGAPRNFDQISLWAIKLLRTKQMQLNTLSMGC